MSLRPAAWLLALIPGAALADTLASVATDAPAQASDAPAPMPWEVSLGASYSNGAYDTLDKSYVTAFPLSLRYVHNGLWIRATVPYIILRGPTDLLDAPQPIGGGGRFNPAGGDMDGGDAIPRAPGLPPLSHVSGIGDVAVTVGYRFDLDDLTHLSASTRLKLPTAKVSDGLGTGKVDVILGGDLARDIGRATLSVGVAHRFTGQPDYVVLHDTWSLNGNFAWHLGARALVGLDYEWRQSVVPGYATSNDVTAFTSLPLTARTRIDVYGGTGIGRGGAALLGGMALRYKF